MSGKVKTQSGVARSSSHIGGPSCTSGRTMSGGPAAAGGAVAILEVSPWQRQLAKGSFKLSFPSWTMKSECFGLLFKSVKVSGVKCVCEVSEMVSRS